jgi:hypothetical protein
MVRPPRSGGFNGAIHHAAGRRRPGYGLSLAAVGDVRLRPAPAVDDEPEPIRSSRWTELAGSNHTPLGLVESDGDADAAFGEFVDDARPTVRV